MATAIPIPSLSDPFLRSTIQADGIVAGVVKLQEADAKGDSIQDDLAELRCRLDTILASRDMFLGGLEAYYSEACRLADADDESRGKAEQMVRIAWNHSCKWVASSQIILAELNDIRF